MQWGFLLLALVGCFATVVSLRIHKKTRRLKFLGLFWAALLFVAVSVAIILQPIISNNFISFLLAQLSEWGHIYSLALILSSLLLFVRESKPEFSRFPVSYVIFPILIVFSYLLVYNTVVLKKWLISIYQGGAVVVSMLIYGIYSYREQIYQRTFVGSVLLFFSYLAFYLLPDSYKIIWQLFLVAGIAIVFAGYLAVEQHFEEVK